MRLFERRLKRERTTPYPGCDDLFCRGREARNGHGECDACGKITCSLTQAVDPVSGRRRRQYRCLTCPEPWSATAARHDRTKKDWEEMSTPINEEAVLPNVMGEQYGGRSREAIRAFMASGATRATVPGQSASVLQSTINVLGLDREIYAETRGEEAVLRRFA